MKYPKKCPHCSSKLVHTDSKNYKTETAWRCRKCGFEVKAIESA